MSRRPAPSSSSSSTTTTTSSSYTGAPSTAATTTSSMSSATAAALSATLEAVAQGEGRPPKIPRTVAEKDSAARLIVVLESAPLEAYKVGRDYQLLNCDDHANLLRKMERDPAEARPDITHQCLLTLLDSPLNKAGRLQIYIHTQKNVLIEVNPQVRIPRTFPRFAGLMVQLLHKLRIRASTGPETLLKVIKNPITDHFPTGCRKYVMSYHAERTVDIVDFVGATPTDEAAVFVIGAFAHGSINIDWGEDSVSISEYPLSASVVCGKVCCAYERLWGIV